MQHVVSDEHGMPLPGALKVSRFSFYPRSGGTAGDIAKNIKAFCSRNEIEPSRFNGLITVLRCHNEHDKKRCGSRLMARPVPQSFETLSKIFL